MSEMIKERDYINYLKAFAVLSIVTAHCSHVTVNFGEFNQICSKILSSFGSFGVPIFFGISGYLFQKSLTRHSGAYLIKTKFVSLIIPWVFCGTIVYLYVFLRKEGLTALSYLKFISGHNSYLYYMSALIVIYLIFSLVGKSKVCFTILALLFIISNILTANGVIKNVYVFIPPNINVFNWIGYFLLGAFIYSGKNKEVLLNFILKYYKLAVVAGIITTGAVIAGGGVIYYWHRLYFIVEVFVIIAACGIAAHALSKKEVNKYLLYMGENSFSIYLVHMPIAGIISNILNRTDIWPTTVTRPFLVIIITVFIIETGHLISKICKVENYYLKLIGKRS